LQACDLDELIELTVLEVTRKMLERTRNKNTEGKNL